MSFQEALGYGAAAGAVSALFSPKQKLDHSNAKYGIRWRVADAKAAGIHPLYAMGANVNTSPVILGQDSPKYGAIKGGLDAAMNYANNKSAQIESAARTNKDNAIAAYYRSQSINKSQGNDGSQGVIDPLSGKLKEEPKPAQRTEGLTSRSDAQDYEDRYHEVGGFAQGTKNLIQDSVTGWIGYFKNDVFKPLYKAGDRARLHRSHKAQPYRFQYGK